MYCRGKLFLPGGCMPDKRSFLFYQRIFDEQVEVRFLSVELAKGIEQFEIYLHRDLDVV